MKLLHSSFTVLHSDAAAAPALHDCWNRIGVEGNATCRELVKFIHCRNCPVYSAAGLQLLDRPLPPDYRRERAEHYAQAKQTTQPARVSVVIFRLAREWLALPTHAFQEVVEGLEEKAESRKQKAEIRTPVSAFPISAFCFSRLHSLPHRRGRLALGLVNVRGELLICASVARLLGLEEKAENRKQKTEIRTPVSAFPISAFCFSRLLVVGWNGLRVAFPVAEVFGIQRFPKTELKAPPATLSKSTLTYTQGVFAWRDHTVGLLDADAFFSALNRRLA